ncbi:3D domain-containing protein [Candidatus Margulisiibacteriota bacterium]
MMNIPVKYRFRLWFTRNSSKHKVRLLCLVLLLLFVVSLSSSARQLGILGRYRIRSIGYVTATAYNSLPGQTDSTPWITAAGTRCREGVIASNFLPIGTKVIISGFGNQVFVVEDRMNKRYSKRLDIWMRSYRAARKFGRRKVKYYVLGS